jgi:hypothetical protein
MFDMVHEAKTEKLLGIKGYVTNLPEQKRCQALRLSLIIENSGTFNRHFE